MEEKIYTAMPLYTYELDVLEVALRTLYHERSATAKMRETCKNLLKAIDGKDEAFLFT